MPIDVVYPKANQPVYEAATFLLGKVSPARRQLEIDGVPVPVSRKGHFAHKISLEPGMSVVRLQSCDADTGDVRDEEAWTIHRVPPLEAPPADGPLAVHPDVRHPAGDVVVLSGEHVPVSVLATPGATVAVSIPGLVDEPVPLMPAEPQAPFIDTREGVFAELHQVAAPVPSAGFYRGRIAIPLLANAYEGLPVHIHLQRGDESRMEPLTGRLSVWILPKIATVTVESAILRTAPNNGARLTPLPKDTRVQVDGLCNGWWRLRLSGQLSAYIAQGDVQLLGALPEPAFLEFVHVNPVSPRQAVLRLTTRQPVPLQFESRSPHHLRMTLYNTRSRCDFIHYGPDTSLIECVTWTQPDDDTVVLDIALARPLSGFDYAWRDGGWHVLLKTLPEELKLVRVLIDPGHGGTEDGGTGLDGMPEKDINLHVSLMLADALKAEGFGAVALTRTEDATVSLAERAGAVTRENADIVLSIHHNALPDGREPLAYRGASTYYYHAFSQPLARALLAGLISSDLPAYGVLYDSLHMTRIPQALAVLVEVGFMTCPDEYDRLIEPEFQQTATRRLAAALKNYCLKG